MLALALTATRCAGVVALIVWKVVVSDEIIEEKTKPEACRES